MPSSSTERSQTDDEPTTRRSPPNVLFVFSDEHRACSMPGEPYCDVDAKHLRHLAAEGMSFRNCISNYPVCSPYRAMLMSGKWPFQNGVIDNSIGLRDEGSSLGEAFHSAGYRTGYIGKWHLSLRTEVMARQMGRHGFDDFQPWFRTMTHLSEVTLDAATGKLVPREGYSCTLMTDAALDFIGTRDDRPWMLVLSWVPPHPPFDEAPEGKLQLYDEGALQFRPNVPPPGQAEFAGYLRGYYAHVSALDAELGRLLDMLDRTQQAADTIVVYTSDHGTMLGSQASGGKRLPFDESCRVPFLLRYPGVVPAGRTSDALLASIDLFPTLCGFAGIAVPPHCQGQDLSEAVLGKATGEPESVFLMHIQRTNAFEGGGGQLAPLFRGVRTQRFTYAVADDGRWCLYDDWDDPYQLRNLIDDPSRTSLVTDLDGLVADWLGKASDPFPLDTLRRKRSSLPTLGVSHKLA